MSDRLRDALRAMKEVVDAPHASMVTYLHDPDTGKAFGALVDLDMLDPAVFKIWDPMSHDHREGDEDE